MDSLQVTGDLSIPVPELRFSFDHSPGPGGQNVNKLNTRAELRFQVACSASLTAEQQRRLRSALHGQLTREGILIVRSSRHRSQARNKEDCLDKLAAILARALRPPPPKRRPTRPGRAAKARRLDGKRRQSEKKIMRQRPSM